MTRKIQTIFDDFSSFVWRANRQINAGQETYFIRIILAKPNHSTIFYDSFH